MMLTLTGCVVVMALVIAVTASAAHEAVFPPDAAASLGAVDAAGATVSDVVPAGAVVGGGVAGVRPRPAAPATGGEQRRRGDHEDGGGGASARAMNNGGSRHRVSPRVDEAPAKGGPERRAGARPPYQRRRRGNPDR